MVNHQRSSPQMLLVLTPPHGVNHYLNLVSPALQINLYLHVVRVQLALAYTATMTPYEIALLNPEFNSLFLANRAVDLIFSLERRRRIADWCRCVRLGRGKRMAVLLTQPALPLPS